MKYALAIVRRWNRQPQINVKLAADYADALIAHVPSICPTGFDLKGRALSVGISTPARSVAAGGVALNSRTGDRPYLQATTPVAATAGMTLISIQSVNMAVAANNWHKFQNTATITHFPFSSLWYASTFSTSRWLNGVAIPTTTGAPHVAIVTAEGTNRAAYINGRLVGSSSSGGAIDITTQNFYGSDDGGYNWDGDFFGFFLLPRSLSAAEIAERFSSPESAWKFLFEPLRLGPFFVGAGSPPQPYSALNIRPPSRRLRQQPKGLVQFSQAYAHAENLAFIAGRNQLIQGHNVGASINATNVATTVGAAPKGQTLASASTGDYLNLGTLNKKAALGDAVVVVQLRVKDGAAIYGVYGYRQGATTGQEYFGVNIEAVSAGLQAGTFSWFIQYNASETLFGYVPSAFAVGDVFTVVMKLNSDGNTISFWKDGALLTTSYVGAGGLVSSGGSAPMAMDLFNYNNAGSHAKGTGAEILLWARFNGLRIPDSQLQGLSQDPWQMFVEPTQKFTNGIVGTTYFATLSATVTAAATKILQARLIRAATSSLSAVVARAPRAVRSATTTLTATLIRGAARVLAATTTASAAKVLQAQLIKSATTTATAVLTTIKAQLKTLTATTTTTATKIIQAQLRKTVTSTVTTTLARSGSRTLSAATTATAVLIKQARLIKSATTTLTASISSIINPGVTALTLTATSTVSALLVKQAQLRRTVTSIVSALISRGGQAARAASSTLSAVVIKQAQLRRTVTSTLSAVITTAKVQLLTLTATTTLTAIISYIKISLSSLPPDYGMRYAGKLIYRVAKAAANNRVVKGIMRNSVKGDQ